MQRRLDEMPNAMRVRRSVVEHVFGTIKGWMGRDHFRTRRVAKVATEMSLHILAFNRGEGANKKIRDHPHALEPPLDKEIALGPESVGRLSICQSPGGNRSSH